MPNNGLYYSDEGYMVMMTWYDAHLSRLGIVHDSIRLSTRHGHTHVIAAGPDDGRPVIMLHGSNSSALACKGQISALAAGGCRVYAPDIIGHIGRSAPSRPSYSGRAYVDWVCDMADALDVERAAFVGVSTGAHIALKTAAHAPDRVDCLALISPTGLLPVSGLHGLISNPNPVTELLRQTLCSRVKTPSDAVGLLNRLFSSSPDGVLVFDNPEVLEAFFLMVKHFKLQGAPGPLSTDELRAVTAPALVLVGEHESLWKPDALLARARQMLAHVTAERVDGAGHLLLFERPAWLGERLLRFLAEVHQPAQAEAAPV